MRQLAGINAGWFFCHDINTADVVSSFLSSKLRFHDDVRACSSNTSREYADDQTRNKMDTERTTDELWCCENKNPRKWHHKNIVRGSGSPRWERKRPEVQPLFWYAHERSPWLFPCCVALHHSHNHLTFSVFCQYCCLLSAGRKSVDSHSLKAIAKAQPTLLELQLCFFFCPCARHGGWRKFLRCYNVAHRRWCNPSKRGEWEREKKRKILSWNK